MSSSGLGAFYCHLLLPLECWTMCSHSQRGHTFLNLISKHGQNTSSCLTVHTFTLIWKRWSHTEKMISVGKSWEPGYPVRWPCHYHPHHGPWGCISSLQLRLHWLLHRCSRHDQRVRQMQSPTMHRLPGWKCQALCQSVVAHCVATWWWDWVFLDEKWKPDDILSKKFDIAIKNIKKN